MKGVPGGFQDAGLSEEIYEPIPPTNERPGRD